MDTIIRNTIYNINRWNTFCKNDDYSDALEWEPGKKTMS